MVKTKDKKENYSTNKAIILTSIELSDNDIELLKNTNIFKIALNQHAENLKPDFRICTDYVIGNLLENFSQKIVTVRDWVPNARLIYAGEILFKGSTIVACIEYLIKKDFKNILIVGDNTVHGEIFQNRIITEIEKILKQYKDVKLFQFEFGNFNLPVMSINDFTERR